MFYQVDGTTFRVESVSSDPNIETAHHVFRIKSENNINQSGSSPGEIRIDSSVKSTKGVEVKQTLASVGIDSEGNTVLLRYQIPNIPGLIARYNVGSFDVANQVWNDTVGTYHASVSRGTVGVTTSTNGNFDVLFGGTNDGIRFPSGILPSTFTLFHVTRYSSTTQGRIVTGYSNNWLDGHWGGAAGVAFHEGWLTNQTDRFDQNWVISSSQNSLYRGEGTTYGTGGGSASTALSINHGIYAEYSDWEIAEIIVFNRHLTLEEIQTVEGELAFLYPVSTITAVPSEIPLPVYEDLDIQTKQIIRYNGNPNADLNINRTPAPAKVFPILSTTDPIVETRFNQIFSVERTRKESPVSQSVTQIESQSQQFSFDKYAKLDDSFDRRIILNKVIVSNVGGSPGSSNNEIITTSALKQIWY